MITSKQILDQWFEAGLKMKATHMIVVCDTFDHKDYPVYCIGDQHTKDQFDEHNDINMQRVMEVYDLREDKQKQLEAHRAMNLPTKP